MDYSTVKEAVQTCPELVGLDRPTMAELFWMAKEKKLARGAVIYKQGDDLDGTFYMLLGGDLTVCIDGAVVAQISIPTLVGESAFTTVSHKRGATVQVSSNAASLLEFRPSEEMLHGPLSHLFGEVAWDRWLTSTRLYPT